LNRNEFCEKHHNFENHIEDPDMNPMKPNNNYIIPGIIILMMFMVTISGCKKDESEPQPLFPEMVSISLQGAETTFDINVGFNQGVFRTQLQSGNLNEQSFKVLSTGGVASIVNFVVTHAAGQRSATIRVVFDRNTSGEEIITIQPFDGNSIFNMAGRPMATSQSKSISSSGIEFEIINVVDDGSGTGTATWTANNIYVLDGFVFVNEGQTLTIEPGTIIKGKAGQAENASALIVARGGKLLAEGTREEPIIFTAEEDDLNGSIEDLASGLWGGLIVLGKATLNTTPGQQQIEGIPESEERGIYGGNDDEDNSGILRYISIRHGGTDIGDGNEINGLTLGAVGSKTVIEFVEVFSNKDDGFEIFGGAPQMKCIIAAFCGDDGIDYDQGFHGKGQFWVAVQGFTRGDRLGEHDGGTQPQNAKPYAIPEIYNTTYVGLPAGASRRMMTFRTNSGGHYTNSIFYQQSFGIDIELLTEACSYTRFEQGDLTIENNIFYLIAHEPWLEVSPGEGVSEEDKNAANTELAQYFSSAKNEIYDPGFNLNGLTFDIIPSRDVSQNLGDYPADNWFQAVNYKGAFDPATNWAEGWSLFSKYMN
jgi:hypothetical protein